MATAEPAQTAVGFRFERLPERWSTLLRDAGEPLRDSSMHPAVAFSYYADADPAEMGQSFASPSGAPLFAGFEFAAVGSAEGLSEDSKGFRRLVVKEDHDA